MKVFIRKRDISENYVDDWLVSAYAGFQTLGADISFFVDNREVEYNPEYVLVGTIDDTKAYLSKGGIKIPSPLNIPDSLFTSKLLQRKIEIKTLKQFKEETELPIFVKPYSKVKEFYSGVISHTWSRSTLFHEVDEDTMVLTSEIVDFVTEYRCFIHKGELVGIKHYSGDFKVFPDIKSIESAIKLYENQPIGFTMDFGVIYSNLGLPLTVLVECNDGWAIGNYGLDALVYAKLLRDRWFEIIKNK